MNLTDPTLILTAGGLVCLGLGGLYVALSKRHAKRRGSAEAFRRAEAKRFEDETLAALRRKSAAMQAAEHRRSDPFGYKAAFNDLPQDNATTYRGEGATGAPVGFGPGPEAFKPLSDDEVRFFVSHKLSKDGRWRVRDRANFREMPHPYTRRSSALRAARRLNAKDAGPVSVHMIVLTALVSLSLVCGFMAAFSFGKASGIRHATRLMEAWGLELKKGPPK